MKVNYVRWLLGLTVAFVAASPLAAEPVTLPAGTVLHLRNDIPLSTEFSTPHDAVRATVVQPFVFASEKLIPVGSILTGKLRHVKKPGRLFGRGELRVVFDQLELPTGETYSLVAVIRTVDNPQGVVDVTSEGTMRSTSTPRKEAAWTGAGAGAGAVVGGLAGGPAGAAIGAGIGGGAMLARRRRHVYLDAGAEFQVELTTPLQILPE
ncbi:MAG: hypothetical protein HY653_04165 [Acidobacteria bacterium]|nr:hypothetical protein [Acidobacteriota bacterium]